MGHILSFITCTLADLITWLFGISSSGEWIAITRGDFWNTVTIVEELDDIQNLSINVLKLSCCLRVWQWAEKPSVTDGKMSNTQDFSQWHSSSAGLEWLVSLLWRCSPDTEQSLCLTVIWPSLPGTSFHPCGIPRGVVSCHEHQSNRILCWRILLNLFSDFVIVRTLPIQYNAKKWLRVILYMEGRSPLSISRIVRTEVCFWKCFAKVCSGLVLGRISGGPQMSV